MSAETHAAESANILSRNRLAASTWSTGGEKYDRISRQITDAIDHCVDRLDPIVGESILDIATGTGWTARQLCQRGAKVTGIDFGIDVINAAKRLDHENRIDFRVADAEALPFPNGAFDGVISTFGVMFCGDPEQAAAELARVCRPGGRMSLAVWADHGGVYELFQVIQRHRPSQPPRAVSPFEWANVERIDKWLGVSFDVHIEKAVSYHREQCAADAWEAFSEGYGPVKSLVQQIDDRAAAAFRDDFIEFHDGYCTGVGILVPRPYVIVSGIRKS